jgi:phosphoglycerate kinase
VQLRAVMQPKRPFLAVVAGAKVDTKMEPLCALWRGCDHLILGGVILNAFLMAKYDIHVEGGGSLPVVAYREARPSARV